jgi:poly-gamma-glutamate capsule biosynthesis protein CapA/YwtB (metallophosphatase superfamily)
MRARRLVVYSLLEVVLGVAAAPWAAGQGAAPTKLTFDHLPSVYTRTIRPPDPPERVDWEARVTALLREQPGDVVVTAVGDMIFNTQISRLTAPERRQLVRLMQEADIAYGNLEFSMNSHPELQRPFYNFRTDPEFAWEVAAIGINLVSMANNHALDFGPEGLAECLKALDRASIGHAGAGRTLAAARAPATERVQSQKLKLALLSTMRYWTSRYRCTDPSAPCLATIDPAEILIAGPDGAVTSIEGPLAADVAAMEDDVVLAGRHHDVVLVSLHNHDLSHHRASGVQDTTPANDQIMFRRAVDAGAAVVLGSGPHVLRGIEIYKGKPIFYSLGDFIYQYRTPDAIPVDLVHQRDGEIERPTNVSVFDRRDPQVVMESVMARLTFNGGTLVRIELIPVTIDDEGPLYGVPRLASEKRAGEIIALMQRLSQPYGTTIVSRGWYGEVVLAP